LDYWLRVLAHEYYLLGDVFPFLELSCEHCEGTGIDNATGQPCRHRDGEFVSLTLLNPDYVEVEQTPFSAEAPVISYTPDENLKQIIWDKSPKEQYDRIPLSTRKRILAGERIVLNPLCASHLKYASGGYQIYGSPLVKRLFTTLAYKDKMRIAQWVIAERLIVPIKIIKVGDNDRPASEADLQDIRDQIALTQNDPNLTLVTHHAFELDWYSASGRILQLGSEFELCNQDIMDGLMMNRALLNGEGPAYASAAIGIEAMIARMESFREIVANWVEERIYKPLAYMQGFTKETEDGEELIYPTVEFPDLNLRDDTQMKQMYMDLKRDNNISLKTLLTYLGIDYDQEVELLRAEQYTLPMMGEDDGMGGMGGGLGGLGGGFGGGGGAPPLDMGGGGLDMGGGDMGGGMPGGMPGAGGAGGGLPGGVPAAEVPMSPLSLPTDIQWPGASGFASLLKHSTELKKYGERTMRKRRWLSKSAESKDKDDGPGARYVFTDIELKLYNALRNYQLPYVFLAQYQIKGSKDYTVDGAFPQLKLAVEADGKLFHSSPEQIQRDQQRDADLARMGWDVLRFTDADIDNNIDQVVQTILYYLGQKEGRIRQYQHAS